MPAPTMPDSLEAWHFGGREAQAEDNNLRQRHQVASRQQQSRSPSDLDPSETSSGSRRGRRQEPPRTRSSSRSGSVPESRTTSPQAESRAVSPRGGRHSPASGAPSMEDQAQLHFGSAAEGGRHRRLSMASADSAAMAAAAAAAEFHDELGSRASGPPASAAAVSPPASPLAAATTPDTKEPWWSPGEQSAAGSPFVPGKSEAAAASFVASYLHIPSSPAPALEAEEAKGQDFLPTKSGDSLRPIRRRASRTVPCIPVNHLVKCPGLFAFFSFLIVGGLVGLGLVLFPLELDTSFDRFTQADVNSSLTYDAFIAATKERSGASSRRLNDDALTMYKIYDVSVAYELKDTGIAAGLLQHRILRIIRTFEGDLLRLPEWEEMCGMVMPDDRIMCNPGMSFINYALPSMNATEGTVVPQAVLPDGQGRDVMPMAAVEYLLQLRTMQDIFLPKHHTTLSLQNGPTYLRTSWRFKVPCCTTRDSLAYRRRRLQMMESTWKRLSKDILLHTFQEAFQQQKDPVRIWFEGTGFDSIEVLQVLWQDVRLAAGSVLFVLLYLALHTRSPLLTCGAFLVIPLALPLSYLLFSLISGGATSIGIINFLSVFIIVGLGADVVFVYTDTWKDSALHCTTDAGRLSWTFNRAGKATIATSSTTALSFLANLASVLRQLREFGLFMGLCVISVQVVISLIYVPLCLVDERLAAHGGAATPGETRAERKLSKLFSLWADYLQKVRLPCSLLPAIAAVTFCVLALLYAQPEQGMPALFPEEHNRNRGAEVFDEFKPGSHVLPLRFVPPPTSEDVCSELDFGAVPGVTSTCALTWCEVTPSTAMVRNVSTSCTCYRRPSTCSASGRNAVRIRLAGVDEVLQANIDTVLPAYVSAGGAQVVPGIGWALAAPSLLLQNWEAGSFVFAPLWEVTLPIAPPSCGWDDQCYCGTPVCQNAAQWQLQSAPLELQGPPAPSRRLTMTEQTRVPRNRQANVEVVYGLEVNLDTPLIAKRDMAASWSFAQNFDFRQPWAQRDLYRMCTEPPDELMVTESHCWIVDFKEWLQSLRPPERFPVTAGNFDRLVADFAAVGRTGYGLSKSYMFIRDGTLKACWMAFSVDIDRNSGIAEAVEYKEKWDRYLKRANLLASEYTQGAFHVSKLWATTEAQVALVSSTALSLSLVFVLAFMTMLLFTGDCRLSMHVIIATFEVVSGLFFFMVFVVGWTVGPIEVLALIVFVGYALDYSLHVAQKYGSKEALEVAPSEDAEPVDPARQLSRQELRLQRTRHALRAIGGANLGSAITTSGCSVFLIFCQLTIFKKLGTVVVVVTVLSIVTALMFLPAMLLVIGPQRPSGGCCVTLRKARSRAARARHLARNPSKIPSACMSLVRAPPPEEAEAVAKDDACDEPKSDKSLWRRRRLGLKSCFEGEEVKELSLGLQAARVSNDPILEVVRPGQDQHGARAVAMMDSRI